MNINIFHIDDNLYQGPMPDEHDMAQEIDAVFSVLDSSRFRNQPYWVKTMVHMPIVDGPFPGLEWLNRAVAILTILCETQTVYVHCAGGISRSVMLCAAYLMKKYGYDVPTALKVIKDVNPDADPNPRFIAGLKEFHSTLTNGGK